MLHTLTGIITSVLAKKWLQDEIVSQNEVLENVLNNMDTSIFVSDLDTHGILFANSKLQQLYNQDLENAMCWEVLQKKDEKCSFCPLKHMEIRQGESYQWEFYNAALQRHFRITDSIIQWKGGKLAHLEYAEDITDIKDYQDKLEVFAKTDLFTETLNRVSFLASVKQMLARAYEKGELISLVFVDIDGLKMVNDTYGHEMGDRLIVSIVKKLRSSVRTNDIIGRYGGDEFVIAFHKCPKDSALRRMNSISEDLKSDTIKELEGCRTGFSFGISENSELEYAPDEAYIDSLISLADARMFEHKRGRFGNKSR